MYWGFWHDLSGQMERDKLGLSKATLNAPLMPITEHQKAHGSIFDFFYNQDNVFFLRGQKAAKSQDIDIIDMPFTVALVLMGLSIAPACWQQVEKILPNCRECRDCLKTYGQELKV